MNKRILMTAFEPFGGKGCNPTEKLLETIPDDGVEKLLLPTSYSRAPMLLRDAVERLSPAAVVCTGLASGRSCVSLEFAALNIKDADIPDNDGEASSGQSVIPGAPNALFTKLDLGPVSGILREAGIPSRVSYHAGTYVCNCVYYHLLSLGVPGVFIHIPDDETSVPSEGSPFLPIADSARAVSIFIEEMKNKL